MNWKLLMSGLLLSGSLLISGCSMLPSPGSMIMAPRPAGAQTQDNDPLKTVVQEFLPPGAKLEAPNNPGGAKAIQQQDMDGDGKAELLVTYRVGQNPGELGAVLLQEKQNNWEKAWELKGSLGYALDRASFADITGDGRPELLLGWTIGASAGNGLDIFAWHDNGTSSGGGAEHKIIIEDVELEGSGGGGVALDDDGNALNELHWQGTLTHMDEAGRDYHKMDIINTPDQEDTGKQAALALWHHDTGEVYSIEVLRWTKVGSDTGWVPAEDLCPEYYQKIVAYYQEKVKENPKAGFYSYYLADAQVKAGLPEDALKTIAESEALKTSYSEDFRWPIVKGEALNKMGKYDEAKTNLLKSIQGLEREKDDYMKNYMKKNFFYVKDDYLIKAYFDLGQSYAGLKETDKAKAAYEKSLQIIKQITDNPRSQALQSLPVQRALEKL